MSQVNNNRMVILLIAGIPLTMILAATWLWYFVVRGDIDLIGTLGTANRGDLVQPPRQIAEAGLIKVDGSAFRFQELDPKWSFVIPNQGARCAAECEHLLYTARQIHMAMGKELLRIQRFYVGTQQPSDTQFEVAELSDQHPLPGTFKDYLATEQIGLQALRASPEEFDKLFAEHLQAEDTWYLMDPAGWIMMAYNNSVSYKDVIADLKFLLKNSSD